MLTIQILYILLMGALDRGGGSPAGARADAGPPPRGPDGLSGRSPGAGPGTLRGTFFKGFGAGCVIFAVYVGTLSYLDFNTLWQRGPGPGERAGSTASAPAVPGVEIAPVGQRNGPRPGTGSLPTTAPDSGPGLPEARATATAPDPGTDGGVAKASPQHDAASPLPREPAPAVASTPAAREAERGEPGAPAPRRRASARNAEELYDEGLQSMMKGDNQKALDQFSETLVRFPAFAPAFKGLGLAYERLGNKAMAHAALNRYLSLRPDASDSDLIRRRLKNLD